MLGLWHVVISRQREHIRLPHLDKGYCLHITTSFEQDYVFNA